MASLQTPRSKQQWCSEPVLSGLRKFKFPEEGLNHVRTSLMVDIYLNHRTWDTNKKNITPWPHIPAHCCFVQKKKKKSLPLPPQWSTSYICVFKQTTLFLTDASLQYRCLKFSNLSLRDWLRVMCLLYKHENLSLYSQLSVGKDRNTACIYNASAGWGTEMGRSQGLSTH